MATIFDERPAALATAPLPYIQWGAVVAGAIAAAAISFILLAFGTAIGLALASTSPTWRDASGALWFLSGLYLVFVALASFGFGGYVAGRMRRGYPSLTVPEHDFRDGMHGFLAWGLAVLLGAVLAFMAAASVTPAAAPATAAGNSTSVVGETMIADELDHLFRDERRVADSDTAYRRAEAARILLKTSGRSGVPAEDHDYLVQMVSERTGLTPPEAQARVDDIIGRAKLAISRARNSAVMEAFMTAAGLLLGAAASWFASRQGGKDRERGAVPTWTWTTRRRLAPQG